MKPHPKIRNSSLTLKLCICLSSCLISAQAAAQAPVKIGFVVPLTGVYAALGADLRDGFLLYWNQVGNKAGARPVEIITEDKGSNKADDALTKARKLVEKDGVHILAGVISTPVAIALREYAHRFYGDALIQRHEGEVGEIKPSPVPAVSTRQQTLLPGVPRF